MLADREANTSGTFFEALASGGLLKATFRRCDFHQAEFDSDKKVLAYNLFTFPWLLRDLRCLCWKGNLTALEALVGAHEAFQPSSVWAGDASQTSSREGSSLTPESPAPLSLLSCAERPRVKVLKT